MRVARAAALIFFTLCDINSKREEIASAISSRILKLWINFDIMTF